MSQNIRLTRDLHPPEAIGTHYRVLCMTGKNKGICYYLKGKRIVMGRSENADIQILDTKSSREHVELKLIGNGYVLTDLGSHNGVIINDLKVTQHKMIDNDKIIIGQTVYKFSIIVVKNEVIVVDDEEDEDDDEEEIEEKGKRKVKKQKPNKRLLIYGVVGLVLAMFFLGDDESSSNPKKRKGQMDLKIDNELTSSINTRHVIKDKEEAEKINAYIHRGQRESREGNYFRAIQEFEKALIIFPNHGYASALKRTAQQRLDEHIKTAMERASRDLESLKYASAIINYCSVVRLLKDYDSEKKVRKKDAETQIALIEEKLGKEEGDIKCF